MVAHILGKNGRNPCANASDDVWKMARKEKKDPKKKRVTEDNSDSENEGEKIQVAKRQLITKVETNMKQSQLKVFRGIQVPFYEEQEAIVHKQFLCATISANLPFRWVEDPEVIQLFLLFRSTAGNVMPSHRQIASQLLDDANVAVMEWLKGELHGEYAVLASDGWKDESRDSVNGVNVSVGGKVRFHVISATFLTYYWEFRVKTYLIDLILATSHKRTASQCVRHSRQWWAVITMVGVNEEERFWS
jgi:hypothetical protein